MRICPIASGSSGNCIYIGSDRHHILIDAGISRKRIAEGLGGIGIRPDELDAILVTHEHADHIQGLGVMARGYGIPMYATAGTIEAIRETDRIGKVDYSLFHPIKKGADFSIGDLTVHSVATKHDAADPVSYILRCGGKGIGVITDLGCYDDHLIQELAGLDVLLLEANHDEHMVLTGTYPYPLKMRILGDKGHLSNERSGQLLGAVLHDHFGQVILGHLSRENNYPALAYETVRLEVTMGANPYDGSDFPISIAERDRPSAPVTA